MVVRITLTVKHIRGHSFTVDVDRAADTLGLKVLIWEEQNIAIENQRLVFSGRELQDDALLNSVGIDDGAVLFLVETNNNQVGSSQPAPVAMVAAVQESESAQQSAFAPSVPVNEPFAPPQSAVRVEVPPSALGIQQYNPLDATTVSQIKIANTLDLAFWVRFYCIVGVLLEAAGVFFCLWCLVPLVVFMIGWFGTRRLNSCCLVFPLLQTLLFSLVLIGGPIFLVWKKHMHFEWYFGVSMLVGVLLFCIVTCIGRLISRVNRLNQEELTETRNRIVQRSVCC